MIAAALFTLLISSRQTKKARDPYDDFHLRIALIQSPVRTDRPLIVKITNIDSIADHVQLELHELVPDIESGGRYQFWEGKDVKFFIVKGKDADMPVILGHSSITMSLKSVRKSFKPNTKHLYRVMALGEAALMGGGPVSYSNEFRFTKKRARASS